jgi:hypothetical protein
LLPAAALVAMTLAAFSRAPWLDYVNYDDPGHITNNSVVKRGLSREGVVWAFKSHEDHWHPLTWLSQMLMVQLFGIAPGPHHVEIRASGYRSVIDDVDRKPRAQGRLRHRSAVATA